MTIKWVGAHPNNFTVGRNGQRIQFIVLHWIVGTLKAADSTFANSSRLASATYGVGGNAVHQYVREEDTAYANGNWQSNLTSISIEHEGGPELPISDATYETSAKLVADIAKRHNIPLNRSHIKKHKEVSDKATACPGTLDVDRIIRRATELLKPAPTHDPNRLNDDEVELVRNIEDYRNSGPEGGQESSLVIFGHRLILRDKSHSGLLKEISDLTLANQQTNNNLWESIRKLFGR